MAWLRNIRAIEGKQTFTDVVNELLPTLNRGVLKSSDARKADLIAHLGWADFLRFREGEFNLKPDDYYREALKVDSSNAYAHTMLGHWLIASENRYDEGREHFERALTSNVDRGYLRNTQIAALLWRDTDQANNELVKTLNEMRKTDDKFLSDRDTRYIFWIYSRSSGRIGSAHRSNGDFPAIIPPEEELQTFLWIFNDFKLNSEAENILRDYCVAFLQEAAGRYDSALESFKSLRPRLPDNHLLIKEIEMAIKRLSEGKG